MNKLPHQEKPSIVLILFTSFSDTNQGFEFLKYIKILREVDEHLTKTWTPLDH